MSTNCNLKLCYLVWKVWAKFAYYRHQQNVVLCFYQNIVKCLKCDVCLLWFCSLAIIILSLNGFSSNIVMSFMKNLSTTLILSNSLGLSRTSTTSTTIAATICVKSAKNRFLARPQNTIQGQDGPPFMTSSTKKESHSNKIPQQVSSSYVEFKAFLILKWSSFFHTYPQFSAFYQVYQGLRLNLKKSSQMISVGLLLTTLEVSYMFDSSWVV